MRLYYYININIYGVLTYTYLGTSSHRIRSRQEIIVIYVFFFKNGEMSTE